MKKLKITIVLIGILIAGIGCKKNNISNNKFFNGVSFPSVNKQSLMKGYTLEDIIANNGDAVSYLHSASIKTVKRDGKDFTFYDKNIENGVICISKVDLDADGNEELIVFTHNVNDEIFNPKTGFERKIKMNIYKSIICDDETINYVLTDECEVINVDNEWLFHIDIGIKQINDNKYYIYINKKNMSKEHNYNFNLVVFSYKDSKIKKEVDESFEYKYINQVLFEKMQSLFGYVKIDTGSYSLSDFNNQLKYINKTFLSFDTKIIILDKLYNEVDLDYKKEYNNNIEHIFLEYNEIQANKFNYRIVPFEQNKNYWYKENEGFINNVDELETITFGKYKQNYEIEKDDIEWIVLDKKDDKMLLLSKYILDNKQYDIIKMFDSIQVRWNTSKLRQWLNNDFYNQAFSEKEKKDIIIVKNETAMNDEYGVDGGEDTFDKIFVLSVEDIEKYFENNNVNDTIKIDQEINYNMCAKGTYFARNNKNNGEKLYQDENFTNYYWLRTPGFENSFVTYIDTNGKINKSGCANNSCTVGVRPAMWIKYK